MGNHGLFSFVRVVAASLVLMLAGCATPPTPVERRGTADALAREHRWQASLIQTPAFDLLVYQPDEVHQVDVLTVYIEGDGLAWLSPDQPSTDPTPIDPLSLKLALAQPDGTAVYLARPCQYQMSPQCSERDWTDRRFAPDVIDSTNQAIDTLKKRFHASELNLVGYSGGGTVAALVAARREDVARLVTVAGNLDPRAWAGYHRISPLEGSLDPVDEIISLQAIEQWHYVGEMDTNMPPSLAQSFANRFPVNRRPKVIVVPGLDHHRGWVRNWPALWWEIERTRQ